MKLTANKLAQASRERKRPEQSPRCCDRAGITLLEVIVSLAIFLFSIVALAHLVNVATDRALQAQLKQQAGFMCQSKLAEIAAGAESLTSQNDAAFPESADWQWSSECSEATVPGLWKVKVRVSRTIPSGRIEVALTQFVLDPALRGSTSDPAPMAAVEEETGSSSASTTPSTPSSSSGASTPSTPSPMPQTPSQPSGGGPSGGGKGKGGKQ